MKASTVKPWICLALLAAGCTSKERTVQRTNFETIKTALIAYKSCLTGGKSGDFTVGLAVAISQAGYPGLDCISSTRVPLATKIAELGTQLEIAVPLTELPALVTLAEIDAACDDIRSFDNATNILAKHLDVPGVETTSCLSGPLRVSYVQPPAEMKDLQPDLWLSDGALVAHADEKYKSDDSSHPLLARAKNATWDVREAPKRLHQWRWNDSGLAAITWQDKGVRTIFVDDGKEAWRRAGTSSLDGVESIWRVGDRVTVVGFERNREDFTSVQRSVDGGAKFEKPVVMFSGGSIEGATVVEKDGTVISIAGSFTGAAKLDAFLLAPNTRKVIPTAHFTWSDSGSTNNPIRLCTASTVYWALHRGHIVRSSDAGRSWKEVASIDDTLEYPKLACTDGTLLIWSHTDREHRQLRRCSEAGCTEPLLVPFPGSSVVGFRLAPEPEVWLGTESVGGRPFIVEANRIEPTGLVRARVMIVTPTSTGPGAIRDEAGFVLLRGSIGSTY